jgi:hypothetical protein
VRFDAVLQPTHRPKVVDSGLAGRAAAGQRYVRLGVVQIHPLGSGGVGEAAGGHAQEHGLADPPGYLITVDGWDILWIDDRLHGDLTAGVGEESADLAEGERSHTFQPGDSATEQASGHQRLLAQVDVQHHLGPQSAQVESGWPNDQAATCRLRLLTVAGLRLLIGSAVLGCGFWWLFLRRGSGIVEPSLGLIVDWFVGLLRFGRGVLLVTELPQQLQRQGGLGQDADSFGAAHLG